LVVFGLGCFGDVDPPWLEECEAGTCDEYKGPCYKTPGECVEGYCEYEFQDAPCDDGDPCTIDDYCVLGNCRGSSVICDDPPGPACKDAWTMQVSSAVGICMNGTCQYDLVEVNCPEGCQDGSCGADPCENVSCNNPPAPVCVQGKYLTTYGANGECNTGVCSYPETTEECAQSCVNGACQVSAPTRLTSSHTGWANTNCFTGGCHVQSNLPVNHSADLKIPACASCHGADGACRPCGRTSSCSNCHGYKHGFTLTQQCNTCHFASYGIRTCY